MGYQSKTYSLSDDVIAWLESLKAEHGSYSKGLTLVMVERGGAKHTPAIEAKIKRNVEPREPRPFKGALLKPKERK